jgi:hypothetical protein
MIHILLSLAHVSGDGVHFDTEVGVLLGGVLLLVLAVVWLV